MERKTIGGFIAALRRANGMTQRELAERLNVSDKTVSRWERDESAPELAAFDAKLARIAREIEPQIMQRNRRAKQHHGVPVVKVEAGKCSGCNMSLPMAVLKRLAVQGTIIECENCGRLLDAEI